MLNILQLKLQSGITLAISILTITVPTFLRNMHCLMVQGIGLQRLSLNSKERDWRDKGFATIL